MGPLCDVHKGPIALSSHGDTTELCFFAVVDLLLFLLSVRSKEAMTERLNTVRSVMTAVIFYIPLKVAGFFCGIPRSEPLRAAGNPASPVLSSLYPHPLFLSRSCPESP